MKKPKQPQLAAVSITTERGTKEILLHKEGSIAEGVITEVLTNLKEENNLEERSPHEDVKAYRETVRRKLAKIGITNL